MGWSEWAASYPMSNKLKWPHSLFSPSLSSAPLLPPLFLSRSLSPSLHTSPSLTSPANCEAVVQHARSTASQHVGLSPIIHNHNRQKGYKQTTDRIAVNLRAGESGRQSAWVGEQAKTERRAVRQRGWRESSCSVRVLAGFHSPYETRAGWERLLLL